MPVTLTHHLSHVLESPGHTQSRPTEAPEGVVGLEGGGCSERPSPGGKGLCRVAEEVCDGVRVPVSVRTRVRVDFLHQGDPQGSGGRPGSEGSQQPVLGGCVAGGLGQEVPVSQTVRLQAPGSCLTNAVGLLGGGPPVCLPYGCSSIASRLSPFTGHGRVL